MNDNTYDFSIALLSVIMYLTGIYLFSVGDLSKVVLLINTILSTVFGLTFAVVRNK